MEVAEIEPCDVDEYGRQRRAGKIGGTGENGKTWGYRRVSDATVRKDLGVLVAAINFAVRKRRLPVAAVPAIELPEKRDSKERWLTPEEADQLCAATPPETKAAEDKPARLTRGYRFVAIALNTAARRRAIEQLTWFQVDFERRMIRFAKDGEKKTSKRKATVPISDELLPILERAKR
jgi:integrase